MFHHVRSWRLARRHAYSQSLVGTVGKLHVYGEEELFRIIKRAMSQMPPKHTRNTHHPSQSNLPPSHQFNNPKLVKSTITERQGLVVLPAIPRVCTTVAHVLASRY